MRITLQQHEDAAHNAKCLLHIALARAATGRQELVASAGWGVTVAVLKPAASIAQARAHAHSTLGRTIEPASNVQIGA